ncbi:MAG: WbqC family protein [Sideroxydans sp.]|nr:WbqC family protein [Sideroxydans sp.]
MQPYLFPYLGYWQLLAAVDTFVILDDVNYINRGWINRNRIAINGEPSWLTVPLQGASQNKYICDIDIAPDDGWKKRLQRSLATAYAKAPHCTDTLALFEHWLAHADGNLSTALHRSITQVAEKLQLHTTIIPSSRIYPKGELKGADRILDICKREGAAIYINPPGGTELYDPALFRAAGIELQFLQPDLHKDTLRSGASDGSVLSILDSMMHNSAEELAGAMKRFGLSKA